ncbi:MAG: SDR family NAD(P)-dependent oxidoreductase [Salinisphaera sp.]|uniref:SDR family NAD(P)-dependent oxidoreductase n=1 Tax=Salinisphaera sp. TaxID=1914330 RepID=UPI003C7E4AB8
MLYNAGAAVFGNIDQIAASDFEAAWRTNALGLFLCANAVVAGMRRAGQGHIVVTGATASKKGGANFAGFAAAKAAQYSLAQSLARQLGPEGIHVAIAIIDGVIDIPRTREMMPDKPDEYFLDPDAIAESIYQITCQPRSAWTFELDLRPFAEKW